MKLVALTVVFIVFAVDICHGRPDRPTGLTCDQLPKLPIPSIETLVAYSPLDHDFITSPLFDCTLEVYTHPVSAGYNGTSLNVKGTTVTTYDYTVGSDGKAFHLTECSTGQKRTWYSAAVQFNKNSAYFCLYTCNGPALADMGCVSNNGGVSPGEIEAVELAKKVPNGQRLHKSRANCPGRNGCSYFLTDQI